MPKQLDEPYKTPMRVRDDVGIVHSYWANCDMWPKGAGMAADDEPLTCLVCVVKENGTDDD
jgi:hypothetical protein